MANFSHIEAIGMHLQIERVCKGEKLGDHELLEIVQYLDPPLLNPEHMDIVANVLDESQPRKRGRPAGMIVPRNRIADHIESISRPDIPDKFLETLAERLRLGRPVGRSRWSRWWAGDVSRQLLGRSRTNRSSTVNENSCHLAKTYGKRLARFRQCALVVMKY